MNKILYTTFYQDPNPVRQKELELCVVMNVRNPEIDKIIVFLEGKEKDFPVLDHCKITVIESERMTYRNFFDFINKQPGAEKDLHIVSNTDIFFDETIGKLNTYKMDDKCLALSRYHYNLDGRIVLHNEQYSQDTWIFYGKIKKIDYCDFYMGIRGCDNRIAYEIKKAGYKISNPAHSIRTIHYHISESRNYGLNAVQKPYLAVPVETLK